MKMPRPFVTMCGLLVPCIRTPVPETTEPDDGQRSPSRRSIGMTDNPASVDTSTSTDDK